MTRHTTARLLFYFVAACTAYFGLLYLMRGAAGTAWAAAYHQRLAGGQALDGLTPSLLALYTTLVVSLGSLYLAMGAATAVLGSAAAAADGGRAAWHGLLVLNGVGWSVLLVANLSRNGLDSPWWMNGIMLVALAIGLALVRPPAGR